jgi:hypothetical protein
MTPAASAAQPDTPAYWEKLVLASYYRLLGATQKAAGAAVGRSERTIRAWEADTARWTQAADEARKRWLGEVTAMARRQLLQAATTADGDLALKILERLDKDLAPPTLRIKQTHEVGAGLSSLLKAFEGHDADPE